MELSGVSGKNKIEVIEESLKTNPTGWRGGIFKPLHPEGIHPGISPVHGTVPETFLCRIHAAGTEAGGGIF